MHLERKSFYAYDEKQLIYDLKSNTPLGAVCCLGTVLIRPDITIIAFVVHLLFIDEEGLKSEDLGNGVRAFDSRHEVPMINCFRLAISCVCGNSLCNNSWYAIEE